MTEETQLCNSAITMIDGLCEKIIHKKNYQQALAPCIAAIQEAIPLLLVQDGREQNYILQLLEDMMYGMSQQDSVFLLDVLRFGLRPELTEQNEGA